MSKFNVGDKVGMELHGYYWHGVVERITPNGTMVITWEQTAPNATSSDKNRFTADGRLFGYNDRFGQVYLVALSEKFLLEEQKAKEEAKLRFLANEMYHKGIWKFDPVLREKLLELADYYLKTMLKKEDSVKEATN